MARREEQRTERKRAEGEGEQQDQQLVVWWTGHGRDSSWEEQLLPLGREEPHRRERRRKELEQDDFLC